MDDIVFEIMIANDLAREQARSLYREARQAVADGYDPAEILEDLGVDQEFAIDLLI